MTAVHVSAVEKYAAERGLVTAMQLCNASGASYRQIVYWTTRRLIVPTVEAVGSGSVNLYPTSEIAVARLLAYAGGTRGGGSGSFRGFIVTLIPTVRTYGLYGHWRSDDGVLQIDLDALRKATT